MIAYNCPFGRVSCDGCNYLTTGGCIEKQNTSHASSTTYENILASWNRRREELMKLSKEDLVEMIIGRRELVGKTLG